MSSAAQAETKVKSQKPRLVSKEEFLRKYSDMEDGYKYEWNKGAIEKTKAMSQEQTAIFLSLSRLFCKTKAFAAGGGLSSETDMETSADQLRRPDIAFYSGKQIEKMKQGKKQVALWLAEVITPTDNAFKAFEKLEEYFSAGVQVVWTIYPTSKQVYVYTSPEAVTICRGKTVCSGAPALPDFQIAAEELFA